MAARSLYLHSVMAVEGGIYFVGGRRRGGIYSRAVFNRVNTVIIIHTVTKGLSCTVSVHCGTI